MQIALGTRQVMDLQALHEFRDVFTRGQKRRHGDEGAQRCRNAVAERKRRQRDGADEQRNGAIDHGHGDVDRGNRPDKGEKREFDGADAHFGQSEYRGHQKDEGRRDDRSGIGDEIQLRHRARGQEWKSAKADRRLEFAASARQEIIAGVGASRLFQRGQRWMGRARSRDGEARDVKLVVKRAPRQFLDRAAVEGTGRKIHLGKSAALRQCAVDETVSLEEFLPIHLDNHPKAGDYVANRHVRRALAAMDLAHG